MGSANSVLVIVGSMGVGGVIASLLLPLTQRLAIHMNWRWLTPPPLDSSPIDKLEQQIIAQGTETRKLITDQGNETRANESYHLRGVKTLLERLIAIQEAQSRDGAAWILQRFQPPSQGSSGHLVDG